MKKFLLGTSALIGSVAAIGAAHAGGPAGSGPSVSVGGFIDFQAGFNSQDSAFESGANQGGATASARDYNFTNDTEIHISVEGKSDNGIGYGAVIELEADSSADADTTDGNADKTYIFLESSSGRVELGSNSAASETLGVHAGTIARATGGVSGDFHRYVDLDGETTGAGAEGGIANSIFIVSPELPGDVLASGTEDANKITYYTPRYNGVQVGASYTPDQGDVGSAVGLSLETNGDQEDVFNLGANYEGEANGVGYTVSATGEFGSSEVAGTEDVSAWALGAVAEYNNFSVAASWADFGDSGLTTGALVNDNQNVWTLGAAYETGPFGVSLTYLESESTQAAGTSELEFNNIVLGADYQLAPGLVPYVEVAIFDTDDNLTATASDNDGSVVLIGAELNF